MIVLSVITYKTVLIRVHRAILGLPDQLRKASVLQDTKIQLLTSTQLQLGSISAGTAVQREGSYCPKIVPDAEVLQ